MNGTALVSDTPSTPPSLAMALPPDSAPAPAPNPPYVTAVLYKVKGKRIKWYITIGNNHVSIKADTEEEIEREIDRLISTGEVETNGWEYTDVEDGIEESNVHIKYCKESVIKTPEMHGEIKFEREIRAYLAAGEHENIATFQGLVVRNGKVEGMVIKRYDPCGKLSLRDLVDVCAGIQHIHSKGMVHGDLHPRNIVRASLNNSRSSTSVITLQTASAEEQNLTAVDDAVKGRVCLIDLGCNGYTKKWSAPEVLVGALQTVKSDVYSIGLLCEASGYKVEWPWDERREGTVQPFFRNAQHHWEKVLRPIV
ncbi:hypothetical protein IWW48_003352 [Coemansia sp. RSA 1200]|nr:hypothetical protein IWW48_003352 [Coemansia sp. RSA 1200]